MPLAQEIKDLIKNHGDEQLGTITIDMVYGGMKSMTALVTETSLLDANEGIRFRGYSIPELREKLPKADGDTEPLPEGLFYLMLIGELPDQEMVTDVSNTWARRSNVPRHVFNVIDELPVTTHPMTQFSVGIMAMQTESVFVKAYRKGINKKDYWDPTFEDVMNLIARLPRIAAYIYRKLIRTIIILSPTRLSIGQVILLICLALTTMILNG